MGTSQSFNLKSSPNWTRAKRRMSSLVSGEIDQQKVDALMSAFVLAINDNAVETHNANHHDAAGLNHGHHSHVIFGNAGGRSSKTFLSFIGNVRQENLAAALQLHEEDLQQKSPQEIISDIFEKVTSNDNANFDDDAAKAALQELLNDILKDCIDASSIEEIFKSADEDTICYWIMKFYALYISEFQGEIFQKQIYDYCDNPKQKQEEIINWIYQRIDETYGDDIRQLNLFSEEGQAFISELSDKIISIWR